MTFELTPGLSLKEIAGMATKALGAAGAQSPALDARLLLAHALNKSQEILLTAPDRIVNEDETAACQSLINRRMAREPVSHILGSRGFWNSDFTVNRHVLDPRPDSETLIETVLKLKPAPAEVKRILDLGTGSGCLIASLLQEYPDATGMGIDLSDAALEVAAQNIHSLGLSERCDLARGDWLEGRTGRFDVIVSNPPYIETGALENLQMEVREFEPVQALDGGIDGLDCYRDIVGAAMDFLTGDGLLAFEVGAGQAAAVSANMEKSGFCRIGISSDLGGIERVVFGFRKN